MIESAEEFVRLVESDDPEERRRSAWESASDQVWRDVIQKDPDMHFWIAQNRTVSLDILWLLSESPDWRARFRVATKRIATPELLDLLSRDTHDAVLSTVVVNPNTPVSALRRLADHSWAEVYEKARERLAELGEAWDQRT
jgi:hypothetical protein